MKFFAAVAAFLASTVIASPVAVPAPASKSGAESALTSGPTGKIVQDLGPIANRILTVTGPNAQTLLIELSPEVALLLDGLGLVGIGPAVGEVVASASSVGVLLKDLGPKVDGLLVVTGKGVGFTLIQISGPLAATLSGLGLPTVGIPVGVIVATVGNNLKRDATTVATDKIVQDLGPVLNDALMVTGENAEVLLIELSPEVAALVAGLGLFGLAAPIGAVVASASSVGALVANLGPKVEGLVIVLGKDTGALLIQLSPSVAALLAGLGLPSISVPVGAVIATVGGNL